LFVVLGRFVLVRWRRRCFAVVAARRVIEVARLGTLTSWNMRVIRDDGWLRSFAFLPGISSNDRGHRDDRGKESRKPHDDD
jgi:hypothetical protein